MVKHINFPHPYDEDGSLTIWYDSEHDMDIDAIEGAPLTPEQEKEFWQNKAGDVLAAIAEKEAGELEAAEEAYWDHKFLRARGE